MYVHTLVISLWSGKAALPLLPLQTFGFCHPYCVEVEVANPALGSIVPCPWFYCRNQYLFRTYFFAN